MESIKVLRKQELETKEIQVGDQIFIPLAELGDFTVTAHKITDEGVLFVFDDYVTSRPMNKRNTNKGGYEKSDLKKWIDTVLFDAFPDEMKGPIKKLSIPSVGELFGHEDGWNNKYFEMDKDEQLPLMKDRQNRIAFLNNNFEWGWLRNATKEDFSAALFAVVVSNGDTGYGYASGSFGVRPAFWLVR